MRLKKSKSKGIPTFKGAPKDIFPRGDLEFEGGAYILLRTFRKNRRKPSVPESVFSF